MIACNILKLTALAATIASATPEVTWLDYICIAKDALSNTTALPASLLVDEKGKKIVHDTLFSVVNHAITHSDTATPVILSIGNENTAISFVAAVGADLSAVTFTADHTLHLEDDAAHAITPLAPTTLPACILVGY